MTNLTEKLLEAQERSYREAEGRGVSYEGVDMIEILTNLLALEQDIKC